MHDIFREVIEKAKKSGIWEQLTPAQQEELIYKYLREHINRR
jgi:hypothetical protein